MRARSIKPGICDNEILGTADPLYTLLFERLWMIADREGRLEDRPLRIKAQAFPYRDGLDVEPLLAWLSQHKFIARYESGGQRYIQILSFLKHQNPHKHEAQSVIPALPDEVQPLAVDVQTSPVVAGLTPSSLTPDCGLLTPDSNTRVSSAAAEMSAAGRMSTALRKLGVNVTSMDPTLIAWVQRGLTVEQVCEAVAVARMNPGKETGNIAAGYLERILSQPARPPPASKRPMTAHERLMEATK
jgi:hypothetical protein